MAVLLTFGSGALGELGTGRADDSKHNQAVEVSFPSAAPRGDGGDVCLEAVALGTDHSLALVAGRAFRWGLFGAHSNARLARGAPAGGSAAAIGRSAGAAVAAAALSGALGVGSGSQSARGRAPGEALAGVVPVPTLLSGPVVRPSRHASASPRSLGRRTAADQELEEESDGAGGGGDAMLNGQVRAVRCGGSNSFLLSSEGEVYLLGGLWPPGGDPSRIRHLWGSAKGGRASRVVQIAAGWRHCLLLTEAGCVFALGDDEHGQCAGVNSGTIATPLPTSEPVAGVAAGACHSVAWDHAGSAFAWGHGGSGRLGVGSSQHRRKPTRLEAIRDHVVCGVSCGANFTLFVTESGRGLWACGANQYGQLGVGEVDKVVRETPVRVELPFRGDIVRLECGTYHALCITSQSAASGGAFGKWDRPAVWAWGCSASGQCGRTAEEVGQKSQPLTRSAPGCLMDFAAPSLRWPMGIAAGRSHSAVLSRVMGSDGGNSFDINSVPSPLRPATSKPEASKEGAVDDDIIDEFLGGLGGMAGGLDGMGGMGLSGLGGMTLGGGRPGCGGFGAEIPAPSRPAPAAHATGAPARASSPVAMLLELGEEALRDEDPHPAGGLSRAPPGNKKPSAAFSLHHSHDSLPGTTASHHRHSHMHHQHHHHHSHESLHSAPQQHRQQQSNGVQEAAPAMGVAGKSPRLSRPAAAGGEVQKPVSARLSASSVLERGSRYNRASTPRKGNTTSAGAGSALPSTFRNSQWPRPPTSWSSSASAQRLHSPSTGGYPTPTSTSTATTTAATASEARTSPTISSHVASAGGAYGGGSAAANGVSGMSGVSSLLWPSAASRVSLTSPGSPASPSSPAKNGIGVGMNSSSAPVLRPPWEKSPPHHAAGGHQPHGSAHHHSYSQLLHSSHNHNQSQLSHSHSSHGPLLLGEEPRTDICSEVHESLKGLDSMLANLERIGGPPDGQAPHAPDRAPPSQGHTGQKQLFGHSSPGPSSPEQQRHLMHHAPGHQEQQRHFMHHAHGHQEQQHASSHASSHAQTHHAPTQAHNPAHTQAPSHHAHSTAPAAGTGVRGTAEGTTDRAESEGREPPPHPAHPPLARPPWLAEDGAGSRRGGSSLHISARWEEEDAQNDHGAGMASEIIVPSTICNATSPEPPSKLYNSGHSGFAGAFGAADLGRPKSPSVRSDGSDKPLDFSPQTEGRSLIHSSHSHASRHGSMQQTRSSYNASYHEADSAGNPSLGRSAHVLGDGLASDGRVARDSFVDERSAGTPTLRHSQHAVPDLSSISPSPSPVEASSFPQQSPRQQPQQQEQHKQPGAAPFTLSSAGHEEPKHSTSEAAEHHGLGHDIVEAIKHPVEAGKHALDAAANMFGFHRHHEQHEQAAAHAAPPASSPRNSGAQPASLRPVAANGHTDAAPVQASPGVAGATPTFGSSKAEPSPAPRQQQPDHDESPGARQSRAPEPKAAAKTAAKPPASDASSDESGDDDDSPQAPAAVSRHSEAPPATAQLAPPPRQAVSSDVDSESEESADESSPASPARHAAPKQTAAAAPPVSTTSPLTPARRSGGDDDPDDLLAGLGSDDDDDDDDESGSDDDFL